jgi:hypothetical protein
MNRWVAALVHFSISVAVGASLFAAFWFVWYPAPVFEAAGGLSLFGLLLAVDVVLGPLLTLIVFNPAKKSLKFDLAFIGVVQVAALVYGVYTLYIARPVYLASLGHRFDIVHASDIDRDDLAKSKKSLPLFGPQWTGIKQPDDKKERDRILFAAFGGLDYGHFPQHHQPIENMRDEILKSAKAISELKKLNPGAEAAIVRWLEKRGVTADEVIFQGLKARAKDMAVIMDAKTAKVVGIAPFNPWP